MSGYNSGLFSWIGYLFCDYAERRISKDKFLELCDIPRQVFYLPKIIPITRDGGTCYIVQQEGIASSISRNYVSSYRAIQLQFICVTKDLGNKGAILGTIHASKGREANNVILRLPAIAGSGDTDFDEESRVLFVGATRAKSELTVGAGLVDSSFSKSLDNGRIYRKYGKTSSAFVEIGLANDLDDYSFVSRKRHIDDVALIQKKLGELNNQVPCKLNAIRIKENDEYYYRIWTASGGKEVDRAIGEFSQSLNYDLLDISGNIGARTTPSKLNGLYMLGLRTVCKPEGDSELQNIHEPYRSTGFWVVPVIVGNSLCSFSRPPSTRRQ